MKNYAFNICLLSTFSSTVICWMISNCIEFGTIKMMFSSNRIKIDGFKVVEFDHFPNCGDIAIIKIGCKGTKKF